MAEISDIYDIQLGINLADALSPERKEGIKYLLNVKDDAELPEAFLNYVWTKIKGHLESDPVLCKMTVLSTKVVPYQSEPVSDWEPNPEDEIPEETDEKSDKQTLQEPVAVEESGEEVDEDEQHSYEDNTELSEGHDQESELNPDEDMLVGKIKDGFEKILIHDIEDEVMAVNINSLFKSTVELDNIIQNIQGELLYGFKDFEDFDDYVQVAEIEYHDKFGNVHKMKITDKY